MAYHSPFHEDAIFLPSNQPYQNSYTVGFIQDDSMTMNSQQIPYSYHSPTHAQVPWQHVYQQPQESYHDCLQNQPKPVTNASLDIFLTNFQEQMRGLDREHEYYMQQEELSYQTHMHQQEVEVQRQNSEELLAKQVAVKEEQMRLLCVQLQELEAQAISCVPIQPVSKGVTKPIIPSFRVETSSPPPAQFSQPRIPSFGTHSSANSIEHSLKEPLNEHRQPSHLAGPPFQSCQEHASNQDSQLTHQFSWARYPGYELPHLVKDTPCEPELYTQGIKQTWQPSWTNSSDFQMPNLFQVVPSDLVQEPGGEVEDNLVDPTLIKPIQEVLGQGLDGDKVADFVSLDVLPAYFEQDAERGTVVEDDGPSLATMTEDQRDDVIFWVDELPSFVEHHEEALLVVGRDTGEEETILCFFDELPLFIEQEESIDVHNISIQALQQQDINDEVIPDNVSVQDMEDDRVLREDCFDSIIENFCVKFDNLKQEVCEQHENLIQGPNFSSLEEATLMFEYLPSFVVEEKHASECSSLSSNEDFRIEPDVASISQVDSLDNILNFLTEDDSPLTRQEELTWQAIMQGSHDELQQGQGASRMSANFVTSNGCPIRHLVRMEASHEKPVTFVSRDECSNDTEAERELKVQQRQGELGIQQRKFQLTYPPLDNGKIR